MAIKMANDLAHSPQNIRERDLDRERVDELTAAANAWLNNVKEIGDEETAKRADGFLNQLTAEINRLDAERLAATKPLRDEVVAINNSYKPLTTKLERAKFLIEPLMRGWLKLVAARAEAEKRRQREEATRLAREAEAAQKRAAQGGGDVVGKVVAATELAAQAAAAAKEAEQPVERAQVRGEFSARARSIRTIWRAEVDDLLMAFLYYQERVEVRELLTRLASAEASAARKEGREIPGCRIISQEVAA
jgi:hypothetical protein